MAEILISVDINEIVFETNVQSAASRLTIPTKYARFFDCVFNDYIDFKVERAGASFESSRFPMSSGFEIVPQREEASLKAILKPGAKVRVTIRPVEPVYERIKRKEDAA